MSTGIDFSKTFGAGSNSDAADGKGSTQPKAKLWLNVGYVVQIPSTAEGAKAGDMEDRFVSLPVGIPVDTMEKLPTNSRNADYANFQAARNDLLDQIMAAAQGLDAGGDAILNLQIQLRRVNEERPAVGMTENNQFARPADLKLVA